MAYIMLPEQKRQTGLGAFVEGMSPYLKSAFDTYLKLQMYKNLPLTKKEQLEEQRAGQKEEREYLTGVSKGEIPITTVPETIRKKVIKPGKFDVTGYGGTPETLARLQQANVVGAEGIPEVMKRFTPPETPEAAQTRLMSAYAQQQQAINPYKALQSEKLAILLPIYEKYRRGEPLTETEKILLGLAAKEGAGINIDFGALLGEGITPTPTPTPTPIPTPTAQPTTLPTDLPDPTKYKEGAILKADGKPIAKKVNGIWQPIQ